MVHLKEPKKSLEWIWKFENSVCLFSCDFPPSGQTTSPRAPPVASQEAPREVSAQCECRRSWIWRRRKWTVDELSLNQWDDGADETPLYMLYMYVCGFLTMQLRTCGALLTPFFTMSKLWTLNSLKILFAMHSGIDCRTKILVMLSGEPPRRT